MVIFAFIGLIGLGPASRVFKQQQPKLGITVRHMTVRSGQMFSVMRTSHVSTWQPIRQLISILLRLLTNQSPIIDYRAERSKNSGAADAWESGENRENRENGLGRRAVCGREEAEGAEGRDVMEEETIYDLPETRTSFRLGKSDS